MDILERLAHTVCSQTEQPVFWSGVGFLGSPFEETLVHRMGVDLNPESAQCYLRYHEMYLNDDTAPLGLVLAAPSQPSELAGLGKLAEAGQLGVLVLLERPKLNSWGVFKKQPSVTGAYLEELGFRVEGQVDWDGTDKSEKRLRELLVESVNHPMSLVVVSCEEEEQVQDPTLARANPEDRFKGRSLEDMALGMTVFRQFHDTLLNRWPKSLRFAPDDMVDDHETAEQMSLFRAKLAASGGRPLLILPSKRLPALYGAIRDWCGAGDTEEAPLIVIHGSGLPTRAKAGQRSGLNDASLLHSIPGLRVAVPADEVEAEALLSELGRYPGSGALVFTHSPAVGMGALPSQAFGLARRLRQGEQVAIVAIGSTVFPSLLAAESMRTVGVSVAVFDLRYRQPVADEVLAELRTFQLVVSVDEHSQFGGVSGQLWPATGKGARFLQMGIEEKQLHSFQSAHAGEAMGLEQFGLHAEGIASILREGLELASVSEF